MLVIFLFYPNCSAGNDSARPPPPNFTSTEEEAAAQRSFNLEALTIAHCVLSALTFAVNVVCFAVFFRIWRSKRHRNSIHVYFLFLVLLEMLHQYSQVVCSITGLVEQRSASRGLPFSSLLALTTYAYAVIVHRALSNASFAARNWWIAQMAGFRCAFMHQSLLPGRGRGRGSGGSSGPYCDMGGTSSAFSLVLRPLVRFLVTFGFFLVTQVLAMCVVVRPFVLYCYVEGHVRGLRQLRQGPLFNRVTLAIFNVVCHTIQFWLPFAIVAVCSVLTWSTVARSTLYSRYRRVAVLLAVITSAYFFLESPLFVTGIYRDTVRVNLSTGTVTGDPVLSEYQISLVTAIAELVSSINGLVNVFIYVMADPIFREGLRKMWAALRGWKAIRGIRSSFARHSQDRSSALKMETDPGETTEPPLTNALSDSTWL